MEVRRISEKEMIKYKNRLSTGRFLTGNTGNDVLMYEALDDSSRQTGRALVELHGHSASLKYISVNSDMRRCGLATRFITCILFDLREGGYSSFDMDFFEKENPEMLGIADALKMELDETGHMYYHISLSDLQSRIIDGNISDYMKKWGILSVDNADNNLMNDLRSRIGESEEAPAEDPLATMTLDKKLSLVHVENGSYDGAIFMERTGKDLYISYLWSESEDLFLAERLIDTAVTLAFENYTPDTGVGMAVKNERLNSMISMELGVSGDKMRSASFDLRELDLYIGE